jgi:AcrR family transcriptional regulator
MSAQARILDAALRLFSERGSSELGVKELAQAAGIARGTIYNNIERPEALFGELVTGLTREMIERVEATMTGIEDPAVRLATGMRLFIRRAHEEPHWGRFIVRFSPCNQALTEMLSSPPARDLCLARESGRFRLDAGMHDALQALLRGAVLSAMQAVLDGRLTWRDAGSHTAELFLRAAGVTARESRRISRIELPLLVQTESATATPRPRRIAQ